MKGTGMMCLIALVLLLIITFLIFILTRNPKRENYIVNRDRYNPVSQRFASTGLAANDYTYYY